MTSFGRHLRARNLSPKTVEIYLGAAGTLQAWLEANTASESWAEVRKAHRRLVRVEGKGRRERVVRFDGGTAVTIDRYERCRAACKFAERPELWLAEKNRGVLTRTGIYQLVVRRGEMIGMDLNPHMFRHTFSHVWLEHGGAEGDLMDLNGWKSPQMLRRYGASARAERARTAYDRIDVMGEGTSHGR